MKRNLTLILLWLGLLTSLAACADRYPPAYSAEAITATVIDAETKKPLAGVVVASFNFWAAWKAACPWAR